MRNGRRISVIIPALNEADSIGRVIADIPDWVDDIIVADNGSTDGTAEAARYAGARAVDAPRRGYGSACLAGMAALEDTDIVVFLDADYSDHPEEMHHLVDPITSGEAELMIGSRVRGERMTGALTPQQVFGNWLACLLIRIIWRVRFTDLGPFRAVRYDTLKRLSMCDPDFGWTVEMQIKAARAGVRCGEVPVSYRPRIGVSKISGTVKGVFLAGHKILSTIFHAAIGARLGPDKRRQRLIVFSRFPEPGKTKTRLIPALGPEGAAALQREMTEHVMAWARRCAFGNTDLEVRFAGGDRARMADWLGQGLLFTPQGKGDLGARMHSAFEQALNDDADCAVIVGTDCPGVDEKMAARAFRALARNDLVLGPSLDGGYYLIGLRSPVRELFQDIDWGTDSVFASTLRVAGRLGLSVHLLPALSDVDYAEDLPEWEAARDPDSAQEIGTISVVIPARNEEKYLYAALSALDGTRDVEIIVADGCSDDDTADIARAREDVRLVESPPGRAVQMNAGAAQAHGDALLFLHADTVLPGGWDTWVRNTLARSAVSAGAFRLGIDAPGRGLRWVERLANFRSRKQQLPYGDQGIFMRRRTFQRLGGWPDLPIMEDFEMARRLRRLGRVAIVPASVKTSARRWQRLGVVRTALINQVIILAYLLGVSPDRLRRWYDGGV